MEVTSVLGLIPAANHSRLTTDAGFVAVIVNNMATGRPVELTILTFMMEFLFCRTLSVVTDRKKSKEPPVRRQGRMQVLNLVGVTWIQR